MTSKSSRALTDPRTDPAHLDGGDSGGAAADAGQQALLGGQAARHGHGVVARHLAV